MPHRTRTICAMCLLMALGSPGGASADYQDSSNRTVKLVSVWVASGDVLVQALPRPDIDRLRCTSDHWLMLDDSERGFDTALAMLLTAQASKAKVLLRADDDIVSSDGRFCRLTRVITYD